MAFQFTLILEPTPPEEASDEIPDDYIPLPEPSGTTSADAEPASGRTLATLLDQLAAADLPEKQRIALRSAVLSAARLLGAEPPDLPAELRTLLARLARIHPVQANTTLKRLQNLGAELKRAFVVVGWHERRNKAGFLPTWLSLFDALPTKFDRCALTRFFGFCSNNGIQPNQVDDAVIARFRSFLDRVDFCRDPATMQRDVCRVWNRMVDKVATWPRTRLALPRSDRFWALPWEAFPATLRSDTEAWLTQGSTDEDFGDDAPMKPLRPATINTRRHQIRQFASALVLGGRDPASLGSLADLVSPDAFKDGMRIMLNRARTGAKTQPGAFGLCLLSIAKHWVDLPEKEMKIMTRRVARQRTRQRGMTGKNQEMLRQLDNPARRRDLLTFPQRTLEKVRRGPKTSRGDALQVQTAVAVEILIKTAIRRANLAAIDLDRHLRWTRARNCVTAHLVFDGKEVKNGKDLAFELSGDTVVLLRTYLDDYRPVLVDGPNRHLFPGKGPGHKVAHRLSGQIARHVHQQTGVTLTAHSFRHIAAKLILEDNVVNYEGARQLLGHSSLRTTTEYYCGEERQAQIRHYDGLVERQRDGVFGEAPGGTAKAGRRGDRR
jgi:integrase